MAYRHDDDLQFLAYCTDEELGDLVYCLTHDKDEETRWTEHPLIKRITQDTTSIDKR